MELKVDAGVDDGLKNEASMDGTDRFWGRDAKFSV